MEEETAGCGVCARGSVNPNRSGYASGCVRILGGTELLYQLVGSRDFRQQHAGGPNGLDFSRSSPGLQMEPQNWGRRPYVGPLNPNPNPQTPCGLLSVVSVLLKMAHIGPLGSGKDQKGPKTVQSGPKRCQNPLRSVPRCAR